MKCAKLRASDIYVSIFLCAYLYSLEKQSIIFLFDYLHTTQPSAQNRVTHQQCCQFSFLSCFENIKLVRQQGYTVIMTTDGFPTFLHDLETSALPGALCLIAQGIVTIVVVHNLRKHWNLFPIKQLSPLCTLVAGLSFFLLNVLSLIGKSIDNYQFQKVISTNKYEDCAQCRIYDNKAMEVLAIIYLGLRELPLTLFALKTLRVSICFLNYKTDQIPKPLRTLFGRERTVVLVSLAYSILIGLGNYASLHIGDLSLKPSAGAMTFQFFCPKQSGVLDWLATMLRYMLLAVSYTLSIRTYRQLDFKRFIFLIFLFSNTQVVLRCAFVFADIDYTTYHEFYYHSLFLNLCGTLILFPYSNFNRYVQPPPGVAVLESFEAFLNYAPGTSILQFFAKNKDQIEHTSKFTSCFDHFLTIRQLKMVATINPKCLGPATAQTILDILENNYVGPQIAESLDLRNKAKEGQISLGMIKTVQKRLYEYCERTLFKEWKKTESRIYLQDEFKHNVVINEKMSTLGIDI